MKNYNKDIKSSYLLYLDAKNLYGKRMSEKLSANGFQWIESYLNLTSAAPLMASPLSVNFLKTS